MGKQRLINITEQTAVYFLSNHTCTRWNENYKKILLLLIAASLDPFFLFFLHFYSHFTEKSLLLSIEQLVFRPASEAAVLWISTKTLLPSRGNRCVVLFPKGQQRKSKRTLSSSRDYEPALHCTKLRCYLNCRKHSKY